MTRTTATTDVAPRLRLRWVLGLTSTAYFMVVLDALVVVTALPRMKADLHVGLSSLQWTVNAYGIAFAAGIITAAALGDRFGRRRVFLAGLVLFTVASAACAVAPTASALIAARIVQGLGGAVVLPLSLTILTTAYPPQKRGMIVGVYGGLAGLAVALGPIVGGAVTEGIDWHWIFWINVPIGVAATVLGARLLPESFGAKEKLDLAGLVLVTGGVVALVWGMTRAADVGWSSPEVVGSHIAGIALLLGFVWWERRAASPMVPPRLFRIRDFAVGNATTFLMSGATFAVAFYVTQEFQFARGYSPLGAGLRLLPFFATPMFVSPVAGAISDRIGQRPIMVAGLAMQAAGFAWVAFRGTAGTPWLETVGGAPRRRSRYLDGAADGADRCAQLGVARGDGQGLRRQLHGAAIRRRVRDRPRERRIHRPRQPRQPGGRRRRLRAGSVGRRRLRRPRGHHRPRHQRPEAGRAGSSRDDPYGSHGLTVPDTTSAQTIRQQTWR